LFVGLRGERGDGGTHAAEALRAGAWGVLVAEEHARGALRAGTGGVVLVHPDPLQGLHALARAWRRALRATGTKVVAITGSAGKTSTKDILAAVLSSQRRVVASPENFNTEIGLPLAVLAAGDDAEVLILEMAMRGAGQIAELTAIAEPDVGVIVNVGPVHLELLGSLEAIAAAKAELIAGIPPGGTVVIPAGEPLLAPHLRADIRTVTFGDGGDVALMPGRPAGEVLVRAGARQIVLQPSFAQGYNLGNLLAAVAASQALGITPRGRVEVRFSPLRGQRLALSGRVVLINDCYNANPMSMRAAIDDLAERSPARRVAVLGDMLELGPDAPRLHREIGEYAATRGVELLVTVGPLAAGMGGAFAGEARSVADAPAAVELLRTLLREGDTVLVKGSRSVGLERVAEGLGAGLEPARQPAAGPGATVPAGPRRR
jgi:UDP-N-acetylmuramoyl-tripeptide--D-alanyl-D-alanine ligase